ncbi:MAG: putative Ig domain-containing protein [Myxococcota bacterium]
MCSLTPLGLALQIWVLAAGVPTSSPELSIDTPVVGPASNAQSQSAVGFDGTNYFIVWADVRSDRWSTSDIYGARVTPAGVVLDQLGIGVATTQRDEETPAVAFDGTNYLVVWWDDLLEEIWGARVSKDGVVLDANGGFLIASFANDQMNPAVAFDGQNFFVVWEDERNGTLNEDIYGARVSSAGVVLDPSGLAISTEVDAQYNPAVAFDGTNYWVVWADERFSGTSSETDIFGARVSPAGVVLDPAGIAISTAPSYQRSPSVAMGGGQLLVSWSDERSSTSDDIYAARVLPDGTVLEPQGLGVGAVSGTQSLPKVAYDGMSFLVAWQDARGATLDLYAARVSATGTLLDAAGGVFLSTGTNDQSDPSLVFGAGQHFLTWTDTRRQAAPDVFGTRMGTDLSLRDGTGFPVALSGNAQTGVAVASDGAGYLLVWEDDRNGTQDIMGARVDSEGNLLDATGFSINTGVGAQYDPSVVFGGGSYLVAYVNQGVTLDIVAQRVDPAGTLKDTSPFVIAGGATDQSEPAVAFGGNQFLVVWREGSVGDIYGARVTPDGTVTDTAALPIAVVTGSEQSQPAVAASPEGFQVVWYDERRASSGDVFGARVLPDGTLPDGMGVIVAAYAGTHQYPSLACDGARCLVAWEDSGTSADVYAVHLAQGSPVGQRFGISVAGGPQRAPKVAHDGNQFLVVWEDLRSGVTPDVFAARVLPSGVVLDPSGFAVSAEPAVELFPVVASSAPNRHLAAYLTLDASSSSLRLRARTLSEPDAADGGGRPAFGPPTSTVWCGLPFRYTAPGGPFTYSVQATDGGELPDGLTLDSSTGAISWVPTRDQAGSHSLRLTASSDGGTESQTLEVVVECTPAKPNVGCGCTSSLGVLALATLGGLLRRRRRPLAY